MGDGKSETLATVNFYFYVSNFHLPVHLQPKIPFYVTSELCWRREREFDIDDVFFVLMPKS
jgi:hypothetical protein